MNGSRNVELWKCAYGEVRNDIDRADNKANVLLTLSSGGLALLVAYTGHATNPAFTAVLFAAVVTAIGSLTAILAVIIPRGINRRHRMFPEHQRLYREEIDEIEWYRAKVETLNAIVYRKYRFVLVSVALLALTVALVLAAVVVELVTR